ncbi:MAG: aldo/keto reductase [Burkholderiaceae bacterium]
MDAPDDSGRARLIRQTLIAAIALSLPARRIAQAKSASHETRMNTRPVPSTQEALPVIGCGTWIGFDVPDEPIRFAALAAVVDTLFAAGGSVFDSSPMYGRSEAVTGRLLAATQRKAFVATKVWTSGRAAGVEQMEQSMRLLGKVDLMQVHNLLDWKTHLPTLRQWKADGRIRYVGVTHYTPGAYRELEAVMQDEQLDFVQVNYALDDRAAERRILPLAADRGIAVLVNRPFGGGGLLKRLGERPLPPWAAEIGATSWSQVLLKFALSHPAVTCTIPGTGNAGHMAENAAAGTGSFVDRKFWNGRADDLVR